MRAVNVAELDAYLLRRSLSEPAHSLRHASEHAASLGVLLHVRDHKHVKHVDCKRKV